MTKLNEQVENEQANNEIYVLTGLVNNGDDIDEAFTKLFKNKKLAVEYVKNFVDEVKGNFEGYQVNSIENYTYTVITAGDRSEYHASLTIEKQSVIS